MIIMYITYMSRWKNCLNNFAKQKGREKADFS